MKHQPITDHFKAMVRGVEDLSRRHSPHTVFSDFVEMAAISISNAVDRSQANQRETRYMEIIKRYSRDEIAALPKLLAHLVEAFEAKTDDHLGRLFHELELHNTYKGQFFTPYDLCRMMAKMTLTPDVHQRIEERGYITCSEPACGGGAMVLALAQEFRAAGINYQRHLHVTATDLDIRCVHMAYVQFALMHIPAVIVHGNTLSLEEFGHWYTPAHILGFWDVKRRLEAQPVVPETAQPPPAPVAVIDHPAGEGQTSAKAVQLTLF